MKLFVLITNQSQSVPSILKELVNHGINGATMVDCEGMLQTLSYSTVDPPPIFGSLRQFLNPDHAGGKLMLVVIRDDQVDTVRTVIRSILGSLERPNTGIEFTVPIFDVEGVTIK